MSLVDELVTGQALRARHVVRTLASLLAVFWAVALAPEAIARAPACTHADTEVAPAACPIGPTEHVVEVPDGVTAEDWAGIRRAYESHRRAARPVADGYRAHHPAQRWRTHFDGRGFTTRPDAGDWSWGLELLRHGFAGRQQVASLPERVHAEGTRVAYDWDDTLEEWYVNGERGLEHGFTVRRRPIRDGEHEATGPLTLTLAVRGGLKPDVDDDGRGVRFLDPGGDAVLTYSGLTVFDADGSVLAARFEHTVDGLLLSVDERAARYPLTIDPVAQQVYLKASNTDAFDFFGRSVSASGDTVVVGASSEDSGATGVDGDASDDGAISAGAAYVFVRDGTSWTQQAYLKASNTGAGDSFGVSVSVSGDTIVVGAHNEDSSATGVDGDQGDNSVFQAGAAYVFVRDGTTWSQQAYLKASNTDMEDGFGREVCVSGDTVVVGAWLEDSSATGVDGDQDDGSAMWAGAAYVFARDGTTWSQQAYLKASNTDADDRFGHAVAASGDTLLIGAEREDSSATGVDGDQGNDVGAIDSGAAYVFVRDGGTTWSQQAYLKASNTGFADAFGWSVAVSGDTAVVGARHEESGATGVDGDQDDDSADWAGAAYVFARSGASWAQQAYLKASNTDAADFFGSAVSVSGDSVVVTAPAEDSGATGVDGDQDDDGTTAAGAAYLFVRDGEVWSQDAYLKASNTDADDFFGGAVAVSGDTLVVGSAGESSRASGINGGQSDDNAESAGAAYVFRLSGWFDMGCALAGFSGDPLLVGSGDLSAGSSNTVALTNASPNANAALFLAFSSEPVPFMGGTLKPYPIVLTLYWPTSPTGANLWSFVMSSGIPAGTEVWLQWAIHDDAAVFGTALSNAIVGITPQE